MCHASCIPVGQLMEALGWWLALLAAGVVVAQAAAGGVGWLWNGGPSSQAALLSCPSNSYVVGNRRFPMCPARVVPLFLRANRLPTTRSDRELPIGISGAGKPVA